MKKNNRKLYGFESTNRSKHNLKAHIILVCKYRKKLLVRDVNESIKKSIRDIENKSDFEIIEMETDKDHIHLMIQYVPRFQFLQLLIVSNQWQLTVYGHNTKNCYENTSGKKKHSGRMDISLAQLEKPVQKLLQTISEIKDNAFIPTAEDDWDFC